jgi:hypothetical protein
MSQRSLRLLVLALGWKSRTIFICMKTLSDNLNEMHSNTNHSYFQIAGTELDNGEYDPGVWNEAFALGEGDLERARANYLRIRANQLLKNADPWLTQPEIQFRARIGAKFADASILIGAAAMATFGVVSLLERLDWNIEFSPTGHLWWDKVVWVFCGQIFWTLAWLIYDICSIAVIGATIGKSLSRICVRDDVGNIPSLRIATRRALAFARMNFWHVIWPLSWLAGLYSIARRLPSGSPALWDAQSNTNIVSNYLPKKRALAPWLVGVTVLSGGLFFVDEIKWSWSNGWRKVMYFHVSQDEAIERVRSAKELRDYEIGLESNEAAVIRWVGDREKLQQYHWEDLTKRGRVRLIKCGTESNGYFFEVSPTGVKYVNNDPFLCKRWGIRSSNE